MQVVYMMLGIIGAVGVLVFVVLELAIIHRSDQQRGEPCATDAGPPEHENVLLDESKRVAPRRPKNRRK